MRSIDDVKDQQHLLTDLRASGDPTDAADAKTWQAQLYQEQMALLSEDVYESASGKGEPPAGWVRASENLPMLRQQMPQLSGMSDDAIQDMLKPRASGFRAEIYLPDPAILGPGYKPTTVFKGSNGEVLQADGTRRETGPEDFGANNFPQAIGQKTDYYDRAMDLAFKFSQAGVDVDYAGHSLGGGLASAAVAVSGERGTTFNAAGLHPETARRFQRENPDSGVQLYDPNSRIAAYQVRGEVLNDAMQNNVEQMDVATRRNMAGMLRELADLTQQIPQARSVYEQQLQSIDMPEHARTAIKGFVDALAEGNTDTMLRDLPLAAGQARPMDPKMIENGRIVDRPTVLPMDEVTALAAPMLRTLRVIGVGAHLGHEAGEVVQTAGNVAQRTLDTSGDVVRAGGEQASDVVSTVTKGIETVACDTGESLADTAAKTRVAAGAVEAKVEELKADAVIAARTGEGVLWQMAANLAPDGSKLERWAEGKADQTIQENLRTEREADTAAQTAKQEAARDATAIRDAAADTCTVFETIHVKGERIQRDTVEATTTAVDATLDGAGKRVQGVTDYGPVAGAALGGVAAANADLNPLTNPTAYPKLAELARTFPDFAEHVKPSGHEATERHLMKATVIPSVEIVTDAMEATIRQRLELRERAQPEPQPTPSAPTRDGTQTAPPPSVPTAPDAPAPQATRPPDITDRDHPGHERYQQALSAIERSPNIPPGTFTGERLQQAAANLAYASLAGAERPQGGQNERLDRIDFVVFNKDHSGLIAGQGDMGNPTSKMAFLPAAQDNATTLTQASQQVHDTLSQQQQQAQLLAQQQPAPTQDDPTPKGPRMS